MTACCRTAASARRAGPCIITIWTIVALADGNPARVYWIGEPLALRAYKIPLPDHLATPGVVKPDGTVVSPYLPYGRPADPVTKSSALSETSSYN